MSVLSDTLLVCQPVKLVIIVFAPSYMCIMLVIFLLGSLLIYTSYQNIIGKYVIGSICTHGEGRVLYLHVVAETIKRFNITKETYFL